MGSKSKEITVSFWYKLIALLGLCKGPIDALLEIRGGDRTAWEGRQTASGIIPVNSPDLYGGESAEGGIQGDFELRMGEPDQMPSDYMAANFGAAQSGYRGRACILLRGPKIGAGNPYPKPLWFKLERILKGWDNDVCWYPEKAAITMVEGDPAIDFAYDGGENFPSIIEVDIGPETGTVRLDYATGPNPDKFEVWFDGVKVIDTGYHGDPDFSSAGVTPDAQTALDNYLIANGLPPETIVLFPTGYADADAQWDSVIGRETAAFAKTTATSTLTVKVYSPLSGTIWRAGVSRSSSIGMLGMNPAHILYDSITSRRENGGMEEPVGRISEPSFLAAADRLYAEGFGLCTSWKGGESAEQFQQRILNVIGGAISQSRKDGLYYLDLLRGDYDVETLPTITDDEIITWSAEPSNPSESINQIQVKWFDPQTREERITTPIQSLGAIQDAGGVLGDIREYYEIPVESLALRVGDRDLASTASALWKFDFSCTRRPYDLRPGMYVRLLCPKRGFADVVAVVGDIDYGSFGADEIQIVALQDVFGLPDASYVEPQDSMNPPSGANTPAENITVEVAIEAPYIEVAPAMPPDDLEALDDATGFILVGGARPGNGTNYKLMTKAAGEEYAESTYGNWCPVLNIVEADVLSDAAPQTAFTFTGGALLDRVTLGSWALWGSEIVRVDALDTTAGTVTFGRACADTVPWPHAADSLVFFLGDWNASDQREYLDGETVYAKLLNRNSISQVPELIATELSVTMDSRLSRPYPPANVKIDDVFYPSSVTEGAVITDAFRVTWAHRNRVSQADTLLDFQDGGVTPADNTRYALRFLDASAALLIEKLDIGPGTADVALNYTGDVTMELYTIDSHGVSLQKHSITFAYTGTVGDTITATTYTPVDEGTIIDGGDLDV